MKKGKRKQNKNRREKVLVIVAHPDDETIWMGGTLIKNTKRWETTIISLCRRGDKDRAPKFRKACRIFNAKCFISDLEDEKLNKIKINEVTKRIKKFINERYDYVFTHGKNGEYGHIRHKDVYKTVIKMLKDKNLSCKKIFFFSYIKKGKFCYANKNANKFIKLDSLIFNRKKFIIQKIYDFRKNSFEEGCCKNTEAFKSISKLKR